jgi:hypothetical protein
LSPAWQAGIQLEVARALVSLGRRDDARAHLEAALSAQPSLPVGRLMFALGGPAAAID